MSADAAAVLALVKRYGFHVFPVDSPELPQCAGIGRDHYPATCTERGKHPAVTWSKQATTDPQTITAWFAGHPRNVGIACGPSGLLVPDEDIPGDLARYATQVGGTIPDTVTVRTGRGSHYYFAADGHDFGNAEHALKTYGVNVRGKGGYVVGPGSLHATGVVYSIVRDVLPAPIPQWLVDALTPTRQPTSADPTKPRGLDAVPTVPTVIRGPRAGQPGERHDTLMRYACSLRGRNVPTAEAEQVFHKVWQRCEQPPGSPLSWDEALATLHDCYTRYAAGEPYVEPRVTVLQGGATSITSDDGGDYELPAGKPDPERYLRGQLRIAHRLAKARATDLLHVHGIGWHVWDGRRWAEDQRGDATKAVLDVLCDAAVEGVRQMDKELTGDVARCQSAAGVAGVLDVAGALAPFAATVADLDQDPFLLNTPAGTLDLRTLEVRKHDPADRITKLTVGSRREQPGDHRWTMFLEEVLPDRDVRGFLARLLGVALLGVVREQVLGILAGVGANGKTVFVESVKHAVGDYALTAEPELLMHREGAHPTGEMDLLGRRLAIVSENNEDRRFDEAVMKRLTGGDTIRARRMHKDFVQFTPSHTPLLVTNHLPKVRGDDPAVWRRLLVVPFDVVIDDARRDPRLTEILQLEPDAIVSWAVAGYADYTTRDGLAVPAKVAAATSVYHVDNDAVARFIGEECRVNPAVQATTGDLYERWLSWVTAEEEVAPMSSKVFGQALDRKGYPAAEATGGKRWRKGLGLRTHDHDHEDD